MDRVRKRSREEGREEGRQEMLLKQISLKFGPPTPEVVARVSSASRAELDRAIERILIAESVDALFQE